MMRRCGERAQPREAGSERLAHGVVGVVVEARILPIGVRLLAHLALPRAQAAKCCDVLVADASAGKRGGKDVGIELRIGARARHAAYVDDITRAGAAQELDETREQVEVLALR